MKKIIIANLIIIFLFVPVYVFAQTNSGIEAGPYIQRVNNKAGTILLRTEQPKKIKLVYKKETAQKKWKIKKEKSTDISHRFRLTGLKNNTSYKYYIASNGGHRLTPIYTFDTRRKTSKKKPLKVAVLGDSQTENSNQALIVQQIMKWDPEIILHTGDLCDSGEYMDLVETFFSPFQSLIAEKRFYTAMGNHDYADNNGADYFNVFEINIKNSSTEDYYSVNEGNVHIISLNSNLDYGEDSNMYNWLKQDLQETNEKWKIVIMHHPPYSSGPHGDHEDMWDTIVPLFEDYAVNLVFSGHDHSYQRMQNINGVRYIVSGGGGAGLYEMDEDYVYLKKVLSDYNFVGLKVYPKKIELQAIDKNGYMFDKLTIK